MKMGQIKLPGIEIFIPNEPNLVKKIMVTEVKKFPKHNLLSRHLKPLLGDSIFTTNAEQWQRQRMMMNPAFEHIRQKSSFDVMFIAISSLIDRMNEYDPKQVIDIDMEMTHLTADIIFRTILSCQLNANEAALIFVSFEEFQKYSLKLIMMKSYKLPSFGYKKARASCQQEVDQIAPAGQD